MALKRIAALDEILSRRIALSEPGAASHKSEVVRVINRISQTGSYGVGWIVVFGILLGILEGIDVAALAAGCVLAMLFLNTVVKRIFRRPRPEWSSTGHTPGSYSMPSAHTSMAIVGASIMTHFAPTAAILWWGWVVVLGLSRIMLGKHYLGDVIVGALLGALSAWLWALPLIRML